MDSVFPIRLVDAKPLAPTVFHYAFVRSDGNALDFIPGQFIQIHFDYADGTPAKRSYSLATMREHSLTPGEAVEFAVSFVEGGRATALFQNLKINDEIRCSGPYGKFVLNERDTNERYLLIGTGTGITPYRAMLPQLVDVMAKGVEIVLLQGARTREELLYDDDFMAFAAANPNFKYRPCLSREDISVVAPNMTFARGYVQSVLPELTPTPGRDVAYLCGNPNMVDACFAALKEYGLSTQFIRREKYVSNV